MKTHLKIAAAACLFLITCAVLLWSVACASTGGTLSSTVASSRPATPSASGMPGTPMFAPHANGLAATPDYSNAPEFDVGSVLNDMSEGSPFKSATRDEELLVIERRRAQENAESSEQAANTALGTGGLLCTIEERQVVVPLKHTDVKAAVAGYISAVTVQQQFHNPYDSKIEAVYVFPLPENAAVSEFVMTIGERKIRGIIREREDAERIYAEARSAGYTASLLTQERPNIFTQKVANIEPGKAIDINITYYGTLAYSDGGYEFVFPMVVGPRYNPAGSTDGIGAVARGGHGTSGQKTEVQYLRPNERSGHDIALTVELDAGVSIEQLECRTHRTDIERHAPNRATITLAHDDRIPNRDFVLRWIVAGDTVKSAILAHEGERGGFFTMMLVPPKELRSVPRNNVELVFVLDSSGSMSGQPITQALAAIDRGLDRMCPGDSFQILNFADDVSGLGKEPIEADANNVQKGRRYLSKVSAGGGTEMVKGIRAALNLPQDPERLRYIVFCTDGYIGNEAEILGVINQGLGRSRVFSFGVGRAVNRYLMDSMARVGNGLVTYLNLTDNASTVMDSFFDLVSHAPLSEVRVDWAGAAVSEVYPSRIPDLFVGRPVLLTGRYQGALPDSVRVSGRVGGERHEIVVPVLRPEGELSARAMPQVWARAKLTEIADRVTWDVESRTMLAQAARKTALDYSLMSDYTAFVAVDSSMRTAGEFGTTVHVPVPVPAGVRYDTTVPQGP